MVPTATSRRTDDHALAQLHYIRTAIDGAGRFTAVPGKGFIAVGVSALVATVLGERWPALWLHIWLVEAVIALAIGLTAMRMKAVAADLHFGDGPARKFVLAFIPSGVGTAALTAALVGHGDLSLVPPVWLMGYGVGVVAAGTHSVLPVPIMGTVFGTIGLVALLVEPTWHNLLLGAAFGCTHIGGGIYIARNHGG